MSFSFILSFIFFISSCQNSGNKESIILNSKTNELFCFQAIEKERKFDLNIYVENDRLEGIFDFSSGNELLEKGLFQGYISGDTIWGTIHFPEITDTIINREIVFLMSENGLVEGKGTLIHQNGILSFSDKEAVQFEKGGLLLTPIDCN